MKLLPIFFLLMPLLYANPQQADSLRRAGSILHSDSLKIDTTKSSASDSLLSKNKIKIDTLVPIYQRPAFEGSDFIDHKTFDREAYRYTGGLLNHFSLNFIRDYGFIGYPNETMIYGSGNNGISYLEDGVLHNNRITNSLDLNNIQSESIDSIEIIPLPRGFLYSPYDNNVSVNFIRKDFLSKKPYSRIKYYQGPSGEGSLDILFNSRFYKKLNVYFDVSNRKVDFNYSNTAFSNWQASVKLKYFLSDKTDIYAEYGFLHSELGLNGGVNVDSIKQITSDINYYLYSPSLAPVYSSTRLQKVKGHFFAVRMLSHPVEHALTDLNVYYKYDLDEVTQSQENSGAAFKVGNNGKTIGASLKQKFDYQFIEAQVNANYESSYMNFDSYSAGEYKYETFNLNTFSFAPILSLNLLDSSLVPSVYFKFSNRSIKRGEYNLNDNLSGAGADVTFKLSGLTSLYAGYSTYSSSPSLSNTKNFEAGFKFNTYPVKLDVRYFNRRNLTYFNVYLTPDPVRYYQPVDLSGIGAGLDLHLWNIKLETRSAYYTSANSGEYFYSFPKINLNAGLYFEGYLFNDNLNLKSGFVVKYTGKRIAGLGTASGSNIIEYIDPSSSVDFTLSGIIQKVATVYFTFENILNTQYYIMSYYPMPSRGLRFGLAWELSD